MHDFSVKVFLLLALLMQACARPNYVPPPDDSQINVGQKPVSCALKFASGLCAEIVWDAVPREDKINAFTLNFLQAEQNGFKKVDPGFAVSVFMDMPEMNHPASILKIERIETGIFRLNSVIFTMPGDWEIKIQLREADQLKDQVIEKISI